MRAIPIALVILSHLVKWKDMPLEVLGSHVFFVFSGFLIARQSSVLGTKCAYLDFIVGPPS